MPERLMIISTLLVFCLACGDDGSHGTTSMVCEADMGCASDGGEPNGPDMSPTPDVDASAVHSGDTSPPDQGTLCLSGTTRCSEDGRSVSQCEDTGQGWRSTLCADTEYCASGRCEPQVCTPDESLCDGTIARLCDALGSGYVDGANEDCESMGQSCIEGQCADSIESSRGAVCDTIECLENRPDSLICGRFGADVLTRTRSPFEPGPAGVCDPGSLTEAAYDEALRMANFGRWLTGLPEVGFDESLNPRTQACATMMANQRMLNHNPPENFACYTPEGAQAAGESNLHLSFQRDTIVESVIGYFHDGGAGNRRDVGHRRWLQSPTLGQVGFGYHQAMGRGGSASCYNVIASPAVRPTGPPFIAYPNAGVFPIEMVTSRFWTLPWSVSVNAGFRGGWPSTEAWSVNVWRMNDEGMEPLAVEYVNASNRWYGRNHAVVFSPSFEVTPGTYRVVVESAEHRFEWTTELVRCSP